MRKDFTRIILGYSTIGLQLAITILLFLYVGYLLDKRYNSDPVLFIIFTVIGMILGFYNLMKSLQGLDRTLKMKDDDQESKKRIKWL